MSIKFSTAFTIWFPAMHFSTRRRLVVGWRLVVVVVGRLVVVGGGRLVVVGK